MKESQEENLLDEIENIDQNVCLQLDNIYQVNKDDYSDDNLIKR